MERNKNLHDILHVVSKLWNFLNVREVDVKPTPNRPRGFFRQFPSNKGGHLLFTKVARNIRLGWKLPTEVKFVEGKSGAT